MRNYGDAGGGVPVRRDGCTHAEHAGAEPFTPIAFSPGSSLRADHGGRAGCSQSPMRMFHASPGVPHMNTQQARSLVAIALMAAFADGRQDAEEREHVRKVAESLGRDIEIDFIPLYQDVLLGRLSLEAAVAELAEPGLRQLAFELAVGVCEADGRHSAEETAFLARLSGLLGLEAGTAEAFIHDAEAVAEPPAGGPLIELPGFDASALPSATPAATSASGPATSALATPDQAELDRMILNAAILNGALELLPQSMASMAIIPLQVRLVYRIGKAHGYELEDRKSVVEG